MAIELIELGRSCQRGKILRKGYTRKDGTVVTSKCVTDTGKPGKTPKSKRFMPDLGPLPLMGWRKDLGPVVRLRRLKHLASVEGCPEALRRINLISNVTKDAETKVKLREDYKRLKNNPWCQPPPLEKLFRGNPELIAQLKAERKLARRYGR